jgi:hypothetical protein
MNLFLSQQIQPQQLTNYEFYPKITSKGIQQLQGASIVVSILNSFLATDLNTIFYARNFGTSVRTLLYDQMDNTLLSDIKDRLTDEITNSILPPIQLLSVTPNIINDPVTGQSYISVDVAFTFDKDTFTVSANLSTNTYTQI